jgi:flagellar biosynthesis protein
MDRKEIRKKAVALGYAEKKDAAPRVLAKGTGLLAERIIELARQHGIYTYTDPDLVEVLSAVDVDSEIPRELYRAVAEVLAFVYRMNKSYKSQGIKNG